MKDISKLIMGLVLSSVISSITLPLSIFYIPIPGIIFGSIILLWLKRKQKVKTREHVIWIIGCILAWEAAYAWAIFNFGGIESEVLLDFNTTMLSSILGSVIISITTVFISKNPKINQIIYINIAGITAGLLISTLTTLEIFGPLFLLEFIIWQLLIGITTVYFVEKNSTETKEEISIEDFVKKTEGEIKEKTLN